MQHLKEIIKGITLLLLFNLMTTWLPAQVGINKDNSSPAPNSILTVKGNSGISLFVNDTSGHVGLSTLNAVSELTLAGQLKLQSPGIGSNTDYLLTWSPTQGNFNRINSTQVASGPFVFRYENHVVDNSPGTIWQDDFVVGSDQLDDDGNVAHYSRFFFDKSSGIFRAGFVDNLNWNADSLGVFSTGFGYNVQAKASNSWVSGNLCIANGPQSFVHGNNNKSEFSNAMTWGNNNYARGTYSLAIGEGNTTSTTGGIAMGKNNMVNSQHCAGLGEANIVSFNYELIAGKENQGSGIAATIFGLQNIVPGANGLTIGLGNQQVGAWTFTAGKNNDGLGYNSLLLGKENHAAGYYSTIIGVSDTTLLSYNTAIGVRAKATISWASAIGVDAAALGNRSLVIGNQVEAQYERAIAIGKGCRAQSYKEVVLGTYNTLYSPTAPWSWNSSQRMFTIGNGMHDTLRSDAMVILKNGDIGFGTSSPQVKIHIRSDEADSLQILKLNDPFALASAHFGAYSIESDSLPLRLNYFYGRPVSIGTDSVATDHLLNVGGKVSVEEARTEVRIAWPDYVFEKNYELPTGEYLENYISENGHLPNIPSATELKNKGLDLTDMQIRMLEKIEELTLMIIDLEKKIALVEEKTPEAKVSEFKN